MKHDKISTKIAKAGTPLKHHDAEQKNRYSSGLEDNLKKHWPNCWSFFSLERKNTTLANSPPCWRNAVTAFSVSSFLTLPSIESPNPATWRRPKRKPPRMDGCGQYYAITETGRAYLQKLLETYQAFFQGVNDILLRGERHAPDWSFSLWKTPAKIGPRAFACALKYRRHSAAPCLLCWKKLPVPVTTPFYGHLVRLNTWHRPYCKPWPRTRIPGAASQNGFLLSVSLCFLFSGASVRCPSEIVPNKISHCQTLPLIQRKSYSKTMFLSGSYILWLRCRMGPTKGVSFLSSLLQNENETSTKITVRYSQRQPPHTFDVPPESTRAFLVDDSQPGAHVISFSSSNGSLAGTVRVLLSNA